MSAGPSVERTDPVNLVASDDQTTSAWLACEEKVMESGRAWQRSLKNGKMEAYASVNGCSLFVKGEREVVEDVFGVFEAKIGVPLAFSPPDVIDGQTSIFDIAGVA